MLFLSVQRGICNGILPEYPAGQANSSVTNTEVQKKKDLIFSGEMRYMVCSSHFHSSSVLYTVRCALLLVSDFE